MDRNTYRMYDSSLIVHTKEHAKDHGPQDWMAFDEYLLNSMRRTMKKAGYSFRQDVTVAKCIRRMYYAGSKDDVHFACDASTTGLKIEFYENVIRDNKCGGRYHFDKMAKMPYLRRMKVKLIHEKLAARLEILGYTCSNTVPHERAAAYLWQARADLIGFQGQRMYDEERQPYNDTDKDGVRIQDGELRYYRDYGGHLKRGIAWHHINNMWWVLSNEHEVHNVCCRDLFTYDPEKHPRREVPRVLDRLEDKLNRAVKARNFEKAIGLRDAIRKIQPEPVTA